jgi:pimeloyl-ACP methyl ester carboxylesterase
VRRARSIRGSIGAIPKRNNSARFSVLHLDMTRKLVIGITAVALLVTLFLRLRSHPRPEHQMPGKFPEQLVYVRSTDDVVSAGVMFTTAQDSAKPIAVIWVHGWGANFYLPSYVGIGRKLAGRGFTTLSVNTRMHDIGNVEKYSFFGKRARGGGYWGVTSQDAMDIASWVDYVERIGFRKVVLVGHSAGWASVGRYQAETADRRVAGLVLASGMVGAAQENDAELVAQAKKLVATGAGEDLIRLPNRSFPSFISAATYLDMENTPRQYKDFFGIGRTPTPAILRVKCPILAFFGTRADIAGEKELNLLKSTVQGLAGDSPKIASAMIVNGDHEYTGEEAQVAKTIARWVEVELMK